jgi:electron transfer flavoprotein alpha subunit
MGNNILVFIEQRDGQIKKSSFEAAKTASLLAAKSGSQVDAVLFGSQVNDVEKLGGYGVKTVYFYKHADLALYAPKTYTELTVKQISDSDANLVLFANTALGKDLAPRVAAKTDSGIAMDAITVEAEGTDLIIGRPVYAGKAITELKITSAVKIVTLRPNVFPSGELTGTAAEVKTVDVTSVDLATKVVEIKKADEKLDVAEADIIVSGGRGIKAAENFSLVEDLASLLGAATGASRAIVDVGWRPHSEQVGQTGKTVSPTLYVALGISGQIQHLAGMQSSKYIVAINKDKDAPIFQVADYGITGDIFEVVPALIEEIKKVKTS